jgi:hypothetical protein
MSENEVADFTLGGEARRLSRADVRRAVRNLRPEGVRKHAVRVEGHLYPVKDVFAAAMGLDRLDFTTNQARHVLKKLGYEVVRID